MAPSPLWNRCVAFLGSCARGDSLIRGCLSVQINEVSFLLGSMYHVGPALWSFIGKFAGSPPSIMKMKNVSRSGREIVFLR